MTVICNTTPLINFAAINRLDILQAMFGEIAIPQAVYDETTGSSFPDSQVVLQAIAHPEPRSLTLKLDRICAVVIARSDL